MNNSKKGFTLSEVLITLAIIGVVAALTIPSILSSTNSTKFTTALKKNLSVLNQALKTNLANNDKDASDTSITDSTQLAAWFVTGDAAGVAGTTTPKNLNVLRWAAADNTSVWLNDGTRLTFYKFPGGSNGCQTDSASTFTPTLAGICYVIVDTNGDKKPNKVANNSTDQASDVWILGIVPDSVIPVVIDSASSALPTTDVNGGVLSPAYTNILGTNVIPLGNFASRSVLVGNPPPD